MKKILNVGQVFFAILGSTSLAGCGANAFGSSDSAIVSYKPNENEARWRSAPDDLAEEAAELPKAYEKYRAAGFIYSNEDLPEAKAVDDGENSATFLISAIEKLKSIENSRQEPAVKTKVRLRTGPEIHVDELADDYRDPGAQAILTLVSEAVERNHLDFHQDENKNPYSNVEFYELKRLVQLVCYHAELETAKGQAVEAANSINEAWKLARLMSTDRSVIGDAISCQSAQSVLLTLERCLQQFFPQEFGFGAKSESRGSKNAFQDFASRLALDPIKLQFGQDNTRSILALITYDRLLDGRPEAQVQLDFSQPIPDRFPSSVKARAYLARVLEFWTDHDANVKDLDFHPVAACNKIDAALKEVSNHRRQSDQFLSDNYSGTGAIGQDIEDSEHLREAESLLIRSMQYRVREGRWPLSPASLSAAELDRGGLGFVFLSSPHGFQVVYAPKSSTKPVVAPKYRNRRLDHEVGVASYPALGFEDGLNIRAAGIIKPVSKKAAFQPGGPPPGIPSIGAKKTSAQNGVPSPAALPGD